MKFIDIIKAYSWSFVFIASLVLLEAGLALLFPLFIGRAIDDAIGDSYQGGTFLLILGLAALLIGALRRFYDSRFYAKIYQRYGSQIISKMDNENSSLKTARLSMIREVVSFLEFTFPEITSSLIGLVGVVLIIVSLNLKVFLACLVVSLLIAILYWISSQRTILYNKSYNDELEKQVDIIDQKDQKGLDLHLARLMKWNIKLSDLETLNFSVSWLFLMLFLVLTIILAVDQTTVEYGAIFALVMYAFQYMESVISLPLFYQQWLRLQEIRERLLVVE